MREGYKSVTAIMGGLASVMAKTALGQKALTVAQAAGTVGMTILNAVMAINPVFLLIIAFAALAAAVAFFVSSEEKAEEMSEKVNATYQDRLALLDKLAKAMARDNAQALKELELNGASEKELHEQRVKNLDSEEKLRKASAIAEKENVKGNQAAYRQALWEGNEELAKSIKEELAESHKRYRDLEGQHKDYVNNKKNENLEFRNKENAAEEADRKQRIDKYKQYLNNRLNASRQIEDLELSLKFDNEAKAQEANQLRFERERADILANTAYTEDEKNRLIELKEQESFNRRKEISKQFTEEMNAAIDEANANRPEGNDEMKLEAFVAHEQAKTDVVLEHENTRYEAFAENIGKMQEKSAGYFDAASQSLSALDDLNSLLTDKAVKDAGSNEAAAEAARKKGFERSKKLQITMAVISGIQGVMSAFTAGSSMGPAGVVMGPLMAALAAVTAGINIAKIKATKYEGGGGGGSPSVPSSVPNPASFNVVGDSGTNQIAETLGQQNANPTKTYVVAGDVTSAQSLERNKIANASL